LIWDTLEASEVAHWLARERSARPAPPIYRLAPAAVVSRRLAEFDDSDFFNVRRNSGTVDFRIPAESAVTVDDVLRLARAAALAVDPGRQFFRWDDLNEEERGGPPEAPRLLAAEEMAAIDGVQPIGPGGRLRIRRRTDAWLADISVRPRGEALVSHWRSWSEISRAALAALEEAPDDARLRAAFGYHEASKYEAQEWLRPVFVFVLDRPSAMDGPRWRVAYVEHATDGEGIPPEAGLGNAGDRCV
jgi:hypothetical protein